MNRISQSIAVFLIFLVLTGLTSCDQKSLPVASSTPNQALTQIAQEREALRKELLQAAPTLTALSMTLSEQDTPTPAALATPQPTTPPTLEDISPTAGGQLSATGTSTLVTLIELPTATVGAPQFIKPANSGEYLPSPTPITEPGTVLFQDDFSSELGWYTTESERFSLVFDQGGYRILVMTKNNPIWSVRSNVFSDSRIEVDATQLAGPTDGYYGLICRFIDERNYYMLVVNRDGAFGIAKVKDKEVRFLSFTNQFTDLIAPTGNRMRADCIGDTLTLFIDGQKVLEASDNELNSGANGLVVGNRSTSGTDVLFDNFIVLKP